MRKAAGQPFHLGGLVGGQLCGLLAFVFRPECLKPEVGDLRNA